MAKLKVAGVILVCRTKCWSDFIAMDYPLMGWVVGVLREWVQDGDDLPSEAKDLFGAKV